MAQPDLLLLHGALGAQSQFASLHELLREHYCVHTLDFEGHGLSAANGRAFRMNHFAENVLDYLDQQEKEKMDIFGYSMGGYVALYLAVHHLPRVHRIFTLATKFDWSPEIAQKETSMLNTEKMIAKVPTFVKALEERHSGSDWITVVDKTREMMTNLGEQNVLTLEDYATIQHRVRIGLGDRDSMVGFEETLATYRTLPNAELEVLPNTPHPIEKVSPIRLAASIRDFFEE